MTVWPSSAAGKVAAGVDLAVDDNAAADACAKCDSQCIVCACKCACLIFAVSCCVSVILQNDELAVCALCHHVAELEVLEIEVVSKFNDAGSTVNGARAADADPRYIVEGQAGLCQCIVAYARIASQNASSEHGTGVGWEAFAMIALFSSTIPTAMFVPPTSTPR